MYNVSGETKEEQMSEVYKKRFELKCYRWTLVLSRHNDTYMYM